jgi:hypothetical protein
MWGGLALLSGHEPAKYTLGVFMPVLANPQRSLRVAHAGRDVLHRPVVQHVRLLRLLNGLQPLKHGRGNLDRVFEPLRDALLLFGYRKRFYAFGLVVEEEDARRLPARGEKLLGGSEYLFFSAAVESDFVPAFAHEYGAPGAPVLFGT